MNPGILATLLLLGALTVIYGAAFRVADEKSGPAVSDGLGPGTDSDGDTGDSDGEGTERGPEATATADGSDDSSDADGPPAVSVGPRWDPGTTVALLAGAGGILTKNTTMFLAGVVGFAFAAYRYGTRPPSLDVAVERAIEDRSPLPSRDVAVSLTVRNEGDEPLPDLRVVDAVPERLAVVSGSPRHCTSLRPGEAATFEYTVRARRGTHEFGETTLVARNVGGSAERRATRRPATPDAPDDDARITCRTRADDVPLPADTSSHPGQVTTDSGGEGVEFYATREYQPADPMSRIDWKRYAKTRELTTVDFRETRAATVLVVVDTRTLAHVARRDGEPDAVELCTYAAERLVEAFVRRNDRVGLALFGPEESYLDPAGGDDQVARIRAELSETTPAAELDVGIFSDRRRKRANESRFDTLRRRMPAGAQVVFLSPMADDYAVEVARRFRAYGHAVTVVSPDVTSERRAADDEARAAPTRESATPGAALERIERSERLAAARSAGLQVVDWSPDEPIRTAVSKATARWSG